MKSLFIKYKKQIIWILGAIIIPFIFMIVGMYINRPCLEYSVITQYATNYKSDNKKFSNLINIEINGKKYRELYLTTVEIENTGWDALDGKDVSTTNPVRIVVPEQIIPILPFSNIKTSKDIKLNLSQKNNEIILEFDYLNSDAKIAVSFFHENISDNYSRYSLSDIKVVGNAKNLRKIGEKLPPVLDFILCVLFYYIIFFIAGFLAVIILYVKNINRNYFHTNKPELSEISSGL